MTLRIVLVAMVSALGLTLPTRSDLPAWCQSAELWASKRLADWDACDRSSMAPVAAGDSMMVRVAYWEAGQAEAVKPQVALKSAVLTDSIQTSSTPSSAKREIDAAARVPSVAAATKVAISPRAETDVVGAGGRTIGMDDVVRLAQSVAQRGLVRISSLITSSPRFMALGEMGRAKNTISKALSHKTLGTPDTIGERVLLTDNLDVAALSELEVRTRVEAARLTTVMPVEPMVTIPTALEKERRVRDEAGPRRVALRVHLRRSHWVLAQRLASGGSPRSLQNRRGIECAPKGIVATGRTFSEPSKPSAVESVRSGGDPLVEKRTRAKQDLSVALPDLPKMVFAPDVERSQPELPAMVFAPDIERSDARTRSTPAANLARKTPINRGETSGLGRAVNLTHQAIHAWMAVLGSGETFQITSR